MVNKYSELSDFEVNKLIADNLGYEYEIAVCFPEPPPQNELDYQYINKKVTNNKKFWKHIDYCNHYNDAMSLMIDNKIALSFSYDIEKWIAKGTFRQAKSTNPCRAIAECYLLIKDAEKKDDK